MKHHSLENIHPNKVMVCKPVALITKHVDVYLL